MRAKPANGGAVTVHYRPSGDIAVLTIDQPPVNALGQGVRAQLLAGLERAAGDPAVRAVVLTGAGVRFSAGADLREIAAGTVREAPTAHEIEARIESLAKPVVAAIEGVCLGGGLELALACHERVAAPSATLALPEVKLGLIPGSGGTLRFTRLAGAEAALEAITSGASLSGARALALGLVDELAEEPLAAALTRAAQAARAGRALRVTSELTQSPPVGAELFAAARRRLAAKARGQLAPLRAVDAIEAAATQPKEEALRLERLYADECRESAQRQALMHLFFAERAARRVPGLPAEVRPRPIRRAAVVGAGTMGGGIAMSFANAGIAVAVLELSAETLERGLAAVDKTYRASVERGSLSAARAAAARARISGVRDYGALAEADIIVEAVYEDLDVKRAVFAQLDRVAAPQAILATNTSSLDIDALAAATTRPGQVVGTHFFSPAHVMRLLENVRGRASSPETLATVMALARTLGKVAVLAGNCDGFIGNRMLMYYGAEAEFLLEEGATPEQIDRVMEGFGFAMGPLAVRDLAGNDVGFAIRKRRVLPADERWSPILERLVQAGRLGQKSGRGYYRYEGRTRIPDPAVPELIAGVSRELGITRRPIADAEILDRLLHPLINEGARLIEEGIAQRASDIDLVYVNGYGFPAWRGGPMYFGAQAGLARVVETMRRLSATHGQRWRPAALLERLASAGGGWDNGAAAAGGGPRANN
jgi:3-hydroxyacyl-CoA dehydrogenase